MMDTLELDLPNSHRIVPRKSDAGAYNNAYFLLALLSCFLFPFASIFFIILYIRSEKHSSVGLAILVGLCSGAIAHGVNTTLMADIDRFTCMVTLAISTNVVISLGMVGALSIVRYRTAVKDPLDLLYLFWAITTGITAGAGMYALVGLTAVVIVVMIAGFASRQDKARVYMMVIHYSGQTTGDDIVRAFGRTKFTVKSKTMRGDKVEMTVEVFSDGVDMPYADAIRALDGVEDLTLIQYNGEYHG